MRTSFALHSTRSKLQWERKRTELQREKHEYIASSSSSSSSSQSKQRRQQQQTMTTRDDTVVYGGGCSCCEDSLSSSVIGVESSSSTSSSTMTVVGCGAATSSSSSSSSSRAVLRSLSVPTNLPQVADSFMKAVELAMTEEKDNDQTQDKEEEIEVKEDQLLLYGVTKGTSCPGKGGGNNNNNNNNDSGNCTVSYNGSGSCAYLPFDRMDSSQRSTTSEDEYFLPFDEDIDSTTASRRSMMEDETVTTGLPQEQQQERGKKSSQNHHQQHHHQDNREAAVLASLEDFFLGGSGGAGVTATNSSSSRRVADDAEESIINTSPVDIIQKIDTTVLPSPPPSTVQSVQTQDGSWLNLDWNSVRGSTNNSSYNNIIRRQGSLSSVLEEEGGRAPGGMVQQKTSTTSSSSSSSPMTTTTTTTTRDFHKMSMKDRTTSLPIELNNSYNNSPIVGSTSITARHRLTRRSSLKKVSSYGKFPSPPTTTTTTTHGDNDSTTSSQSPSLKRNVSFGNMQIREYNIALSDHPSCSYGPPIQLSWEYKEKEVVPVTQYDEDRTRMGRRGGHELLLSFYERHFMLIKQAGYSKREIKETMKEVERVKRERRVTDLFLPAMPLDETMENVVDKVKTYFTLLGGGGGGKGNDTTKTNVTSQQPHQQQQQYHHYDGMHQHPRRQQFV